MVTVHTKIDISIRQGQPKLSSWPINREAPFDSISLRVLWWLKEVQQRELYTIQSLPHGMDYSIAESPLVSELIKRGRDILIPIN